MRLGGNIKQACQPRGARAALDVLVLRGMLWVVFGVEHRIAEVLNLALAKARILAWVQGGDDIMQAGAAIVDYLGICRRHGTYTTADSGC